MKETSMMPADKSPRRAALAAAVFLIAAASARAAAVADKSGIEWVAIPGGKFIMGADDAGPDARPRHEVAVKSFRMAKTLVTNKQYEACVAAGACARACVRRRVQRL